ARQRPLAPRVVRRVVHADLPGIPVAYPDPTLGVGPDASRTLVLGRRLDDGRLAGVEVDPGDVIAGERRVVDVATGPRPDAVRPAPGRRFPHLHVAARGIEPTVVAALPGKPPPPALIESERVEVGVPGVGGQRPHFEGAARRVIADDGVLTPVGDPCRTIGPDDDAMRCRTPSERNLLVFPGLRIEDAELSRRLRRVINRAAGLRRGGDVVRMR